METTPITPGEVEDLKDSKLPPEVIEIFNELIIKNWNGTCADVAAQVAAVEVASKLDITTDEVYSRKLLDVEHMYRQAGWDVEYESPRFTFSKPSKRSLR